MVSRLCISANAYKMKMIAVKNRYMAHLGGDKLYEDELKESILSFLCS